MGTMRRLGLFAAIAAGLAVPCLAAPAGIVTYELENGSGLSENVPVTFGAAFVPGDVPAGSSVVAVDREGKSIPIQVDAKAHNADGSLRHAVITLDVPHLGSRSFAVTLERGQPAGGAAVTPAALPSNFDAVVDLNVGGRHLTASARELLAKTKPQTWLEGPLATEWWVSGPLHDASGRPDPHLTAHFGIRSYGQNRPLRVEVDVENTWTWAPKPEAEIYDADIRIDGKSVFSQPGIVQFSQTRWRKLFWAGEPADVFVKQNIAYLKRTGAIPNYSPSLRASDINLGRLLERFDKSDRAPMANSLITAYMPTTGARDDIGPLPGWTVAYLITMDKRAEDMMNTLADLGGSFTVHFRNDKTGRPLTSEDYPDISLHENYMGRPGFLPWPDRKGRPWQQVAQPAHEPSLAFVPYLVTGDRYYLEELQFWSQWNAWMTAPQYHGQQKNLIHWDEVRGQAWSLRTLAQAAYITPDKDPLKPTLLREIKANIDWYNQNYAFDKDANIFHAIVGKKAEGFQQWQGDFLLWSSGYVDQLGFHDIKPFVQWQAYSPIQRMTNPQYCWVLAEPYVWIIGDKNANIFTSWHEAYVATFNRWKKRDIDPDKVKCGSSEMGEAFNLRAGEMISGAHDGSGYPANLQPALAAAIDAHEPGAVQAWNKFMARPEPAIDPMWDIVPRSME